MFRSLLCTQITALTHLENFTWLFICGTNWLFLEQSDLERTDRIARKRGEGIGERERRKGSLSQASFPFALFSSFSSLLVSLVLWKLFINSFKTLALFYAKCVRLHAHWNHLLENFTSYFIYVEMYRLFAQKNFSEFRWTTQFSISWLIMNRTLDDKIVPMSKFNRRLRAI